VVTDAVNSLPSTRENVWVRVHPSDAQWVREAASRLDAEMSVTGDDSVLAGGCKVETRHSLVDYTVEKRFQKAVQSMLEQQLGSASAGESEERDVLDEDEPGESDDDQQPG
jgi:flagellar assembly protein FliH